MARHDLSENHLLGEVFCSYGYAPPGCTPGGEGRHQYEKRRSIHPRTSSATMAITAAGIAPARIVFVSAIATPRNTNVPKPPPPITAAIVAVPIVVTVAMRIPESTVD